MADTIKTAALIPAAGIGTRLGLGPKALLRLGNTSLLEVIIDTLLKVVDSVLVAVPMNHQSSFLCFASPSVQLVPGGHTRQQSIELMAQVCEAETLLIQDVARPFASKKLISEVLIAAQNDGAAGAFLPATVPVGKIGNSQVEQYWSCQQAGIFQAPQAFQRAVLNTAITTAGLKQYQSTAQMVIAAGYSLTAVTGEPENIKITTHLDWQIARSVIAPNLGIT